VNHPANSANKGAEENNHGRDENGWKRDSALTGFLAKNGWKWW